VGEPADWWLASIAKMRRECPGQLATSGAVEVYGFGEDGDWAEGESWVAVGR
jgi:hypothetical protein